METERILLRHWQDSDADVLYEYAKEPEVGERAGWPPHNSREQSLEIIRTVFNNPTTWAIVLKETGKVVGAIGYGPSCDCSLPSREGEPTVGYWVGKPYWGMGICTEALQIMIEHIRKKILRLGVPLLLMGSLFTNATGKVEIAHMWFVESLLIFLLSLQMPKKSLLRAF